MSSQISVSSELLATYAGLGTYDGGQYYRGEECHACVKDLIRALREDDSQCEIRRHLGRAGILKKDLLPILVDSADHSPLRNDVVRLLVNLTQPAYLCFGNTYPQGKETELMRCFLEVNLYLRLYKEAFTTEAAMNVLGAMLADLCQKEWEEREDEDVIVIERILLLIRNLLHISSDQQEEKHTEEDINLHDLLIWNLHINGIDELLLFLGSNPAESQWCMHVLEIFFLVFKEQSASTLARTGKEKSAKERKKDEEMIEEVLLKERVRTRNASKIRSMRHPSFGGTFVVKNQKSISGEVRVYHRPIADLKSNSYDAEKRPRRKDKRRRPAVDMAKKHVSTYSVCLVLKNLCVQFLECCYNPLMKVVKESIMRQRTMENDETYYLWCLRFFMEFNRIHDFRVDIVGETLHLQTLHYLITLIANYYESMVVEKRSIINARQWAQRLHYVVQGYKEILLYIQQMSKSSDENLQESAKVIMSNMFYHSEYREVVVTLLRNFYEVFQTRAFLRDTVETAHAYTKMMEQYSGQNQHMVVQERRRGGGKGGAKKKKKKGGSNKVLTEDQLIDLWETIDARVGELMEGVEPLPTSRSPFDPSSQFSVDDQKVGTMGRIRMLLIDACHPEAVSLLRAARGVWPGAEFGSPGLSVDEEMDVMREILLNPVAALPVTHLLDGGGEEWDSDGEGGVAGDGPGVTVELEFNFKTYLQRFANNKIVRVYSLVLADYSSNQDTVNHAVVKMLYRIAVQLKMCPLLYHISIFRTLQAILAEPPLPRFKDLQKLGRHVVQGFFHMAATNPVMFVELMLWKTSKDCYELEMGYGTIEKEKELVRKSAVWTREQEEELATLYQAYKDEEDVVGCLEAALEGSEVKRNRRQIAKQLVKMKVAERKDLQKTRKHKGVWSEEEVERLREVFAELQSDPSLDPKSLVSAVSSHFPHRGVNDVKGQLREAGLLAGPPQRGRGKGQGQSGASDEGESVKRYKSAAIVNSSEDDSTDAESEPQRQSPSSGRGPTASGGRGSSGGAKVSECVRELSGCGQGEVLQWLQGYLMDEARDRALDDDWEEMCIVAVSQPVARALEGAVFRRLLRALGLQPPSQQESYWRIPAHMSPQQLTEAADALGGGRSAEGVASCIDQSQSSSHVTSDGDRSCDHMKSYDRVDSDADQSDEEFSDREELSKGAALKLLARARQPEAVASPTQEAPPKRPRLALQSEFLEWEDETDPGSMSGGGHGAGVGGVRSSQGRAPGRRRKGVGLDSSDEEDCSITAEERSRDTASQDVIEEHLVVCSDSD